MMEEMQQEKAANFILSILSTMSTDAKADLVSLLQSSGYDVTMDTSSDMLLEKALFAVKDSSKFKNLLITYIKENFGETSFSGNEEGFYEVTGAGKALRGIGSGIKSAGSWVGSNVLTKDTISALTGAGVGYLSGRLQDKANKAGDERAIELAKQQARAAEAQAAAEANRLAQSQAGAGSAGSTASDTKKGTPKWVLPVAIGAGVLILGTVILLAVRKK
jgi:hypothetical protein